MAAVSTHKSTVLSPAFLLGIAGPVLWASLGQLLGIWSSDWLILILVVLYMAIGYYCWRGSVRNSIGNLVKVYLCVPIGVFLSVQLDWYVWRYDRGVWLFEIVVIWAIALLPLALGAIIGRFTKFKTSPQAAEKRF